MIHRIAVLLNRFKKRPNVRRSSWISSDAIVPKSCVIGEYVKIKDHVTLDENVFVNDYSKIGGIAHIGTGTKIDSFVIICSCSSDGGEKHRNSPSQFAIQEADVPIKIGKFVRIEGNSCITKDVTIGNRAIVMMGSVVMNDIPSDAIVAGNPAKIVGWLDDKGRSVGKLRI